MISKINNATATQAENEESQTTELVSVCSDRQTERLRVTVN